MGPLAQLGRPLGAFYRVRPRKSAAPPAAENFMSPPVQNQCAGKTRFGTRCNKRVDSPRTTCQRHDTSAEAIESRRASASHANSIMSARRRRQKRRSPAPIALRTASDIAAALEKAAGILTQRGTSADVARANALSRIATAATGALRVLELENQVNELQKLVADRIDDANEAPNGH